MIRIKSTYRLAIALLLCAGAGRPQTPTNSYRQFNLASDVPGIAATVDPHLINPWGLNRTSGSLAGGGWFVSDNGSGFVSDLSGYAGYEGTYYIVPSAGGQATGSPSGSCVFGMINTFTTLDGTIQQPGSGTGTKIVVNSSSKGAVYTACTEWKAHREGPSTLFVANNAGGVEAYNDFFNPITLEPGAFLDPNAPSDFKPYGLFTGGTQTPNGRIWVAFFNGTPGAGQGYVDAFDLGGHLLLSLQHGSWMDQPSGIAQAPASGFGAFNNAILVAMAGSGLIAVFSPTTGNFNGFLKRPSGQYLVNPGIRGVGFGSGSIASGPTTTLYFTAGIYGFTHGLFGSITAN